MFGEIKCVENEREKNCTCPMKFKISREIKTSDVSLHNSGVTVWAHELIDWVYKKFELLRFLKIIKEYNTEVINLL